MTYLKRHWKSIPLLAGVAALGACVTLFRVGDTISFSHEQHLKEEVACLDCHRGINEAFELAPRLAGARSRTFIPSHSRCDTCHEKKRKDCDYCHSDSDNAVRSPPRDVGLTFSHRKHMKPANGNCMRCHEEIPRANSSDVSRIPDMAVCTESCHAQDMRELKCDGCHQTLERYPLESIRTIAHSGSFEHKHAGPARESGAMCSKCHDRTFCSDCHSNTQVIPAEAFFAERSTRSYIHPSPYLAIHGYEARSRRDRCDTCHSTSSCVSCHATFGVGGLDSLEFGPHPAGWQQPESPEFHGLEARRDIASCAACHDQGAASNCVKCHQVGGAGGNPHPPGFQRPDKAADNRMCRACH